jgi:hypothetical protein
VAERNLTYEEWSRLSEKEKGERYQELSEHDKFRVRISMYPGVRQRRCNSCVHYWGFAKCAAFPDGTTKEHRNKVDKDPETPCATQKSRVKAEKTKIFFQKASSESFGDVSFKERSGRFKA